MAQANTAARNCLDTTAPTTGHVETRDSGLTDGFWPAALIRAPTHVVFEEYGMLVLNRSTSTLGRSTECTLQICSLEVSRKHSRFQFEDNQWWIVDVNSTNGVYVDGRKIETGKAVALKDGCKITFARSFRYIFRGAIPRASLDRNLQSTVSHHCNNPAKCNEVATQEEHDQNELNLVSEIYLLKNRLKQVQSEKIILDSKLGQYRIMANGIKLTRIELDHQELKLASKHNHLDVLINKYRKLCAEIPEKFDEKFYKESSAELKRQLYSELLQEVICPICKDYLVSPVLLNCSHSFCLQCITDWKNHSQLRCPVCRKLIEHQSPVLSLENITKIMLDQVLNEIEKKEREEFIETQKQERAIATQTANAASNLFIQRILRIIQQRFDNNEVEFNVDFINDESDPESEEADQEDGEEEEDEDDQSLNDAMIHLVDEEDEIDEENVENVDDQYDSDLDNIDISNIVNESFPSFTSEHDQSENEEEEDEEQMSAASSSTAHSDTSDSYASLNSDDANDSPSNDNHSSPGRVRTARRNRCSTSPYQRAY